MSMKLLDDYFKIQAEIYEYFGYREDWVVFPIDDSTDKYWKCDGETVDFADSEEELESEEGNYYENEVYHQRFLPKAIYEGKEYTMIVVDTHTDGNRFLQIFSNALRRES